MSREAFAIALSGYTSLAEAENGSTRPVDRLHGVGHGQQARSGKNARLEAHRGKLVSLGAEVIRLTRSGQESAFPKAVDKLAERLKDDQRLKLTEELATRIALQAVLEISMSVCPSCKGRRDAEGICSVPADGPDRFGRVPMVACPTCKGVGVKRFNDRERRQVLGTHPRDLAQAISRASWLLAEAVTLAEEHGVRMVNRW